MDPKSIRLCPRGFESLRCRFAIPVDMMIFGMTVWQQFWDGNLVILLTFTNKGRHRCPHPWHAGPILLAPVPPDFWIQSPETRFVFMQKFEIQAETNISIPSLKNHINRFSGKY